MLASSANLPAALPPVMANPMVSPSESVATTVPTSAPTTAVSATSSSWSWITGGCSTSPTSTVTVALAVRVPSSTVALNVFEPTASVAAARATVTIPAEETAKSAPAAENVSSAAGVSSSVATSVPTTVPAAAPSGTVKVCAAISGASLTAVILMVKVAALGAEVPSSAEIETVDVPPRVGLPVIVRVTVSYSRPLGRPVTVTVTSSSSGSVTASVIGVIASSSVSVTSSTSSITGDSSTSVTFTVIVAVSLSRPSLARTVSVRDGVASWSSAEVAVTTPVFASMEKSSPTRLQVRRSPSGSSPVTAPTSVPAGPSSTARVASSTTGARLSGASSRTTPRARTSQTEVSRPSVVRKRGA